MGSSKLSKLSCEISGEWEAAVDSGTVKGLALDSFTMGIKLLGLRGERPMPDLTGRPWWSVLRGIKMKHASPILKDHIQAFLDMCGE